jgi:hypothetical protein
MWLRIKNFLRLKSQEKYVTEIALTSQSVRVLLSKEKGVRRFVEPEIGQREVIL